MKRSNFILLFTALLTITGCNNNNNSNNSTSEIEEKEYYATILSNEDVVYIYGIVNETFDLSTINSKLINDKVPTYTYEGDGLLINNETLTFKKKGMYLLTANFDNEKSYSIQISVNDDEQSRYNYPQDIDFTKYTLHTGKDELITPNNDSLTIESTSSNEWTRISYELEKNYSQYYTIDLDVSLLSSLDDTRWCSLVFSDTSTGSTNSNYLQFDLRKTMNLSNSIEITNFYTNPYTYPYVAKWPSNAPKVIDPNSKIHMQLKVANTKAYCYLSYDNKYQTSFMATIPSTSGGNFGFQCSGCKVKFENVKISLNSSLKLSTNLKEENSIVNISNEKYKLKPNIICSGVENLSYLSNCQQYFIKVKNNNVYDLNDIKIDSSLTTILQEYLGVAIPNIQIDDKDTLMKVIEIVNSYKIIDLAIYSENKEVLKMAKDEIPYVRLGYIPTNLSKFETYDEVGTVCHEAGESYANMLLIDSNLLTKENIIKVTSLGYSIVANAKDGENYSIINSALSGCSLILASVNKDSLKQINMLYDNDIFTIDDKGYSLFSVPLATGHRGAGTTNDNSKRAFPENTVESFKWAYENGAFAIELDVHTTKDGKLAVIHDDTTNSVSSTNLSIKNSTMDEIRNAPLRHNGAYTTDYHIPSLDEVFDAFSTDKYKDKSIVIEIKDNLYETGVKAVELAKEKGWYNRISLITFNSQTAKKLKDKYLGLQVGYLNTVYRNNNDEYWASVKNFLANGVGLASQLTTISKEALEESNARGQMYWLWTFDSNTANKLKDLIIDGNKAFTTNYLYSFTNNKYRLVYDDTISLKNNQSYNIEIKSQNYKNKFEDESDFEIIVLSDNATSDGTKITRTGEGTIYAVAKMKTTWKLLETSDYSNVDFYIYSNLITIN